LLNQALFVLVIIGIIYTSILSIIGVPQGYLLTLTVDLFIFILPWVCNFMGKIFWSRFYVSIVFPLWNCLVILLSGGFFGQSIIAATMVILTAACFKNYPKIQRNLIGFNIIIHCSTLIYAAFFPPLLYIIDFPLDEVFTLIIFLNLIYAIFYTHNKEKEQLIGDLKQKNLDLKEKTEELERFTYIASHDLKSPLRNIMSFTELIEKKINKKEYHNLTEYLSFVKGGTKQMNTLIQDILELSKISHHEQEVLQPVSLNQVLVKAKDNLTQEIELKKAVLHFDQLPTYPCNESEFVVLFQNLLQNGIKYNDKAIPTLQVWASQNPNFIYINFKDNGIGIASEYFQQIFQYFKRLHTQVEYSGTGIGLGLCKKIVVKYQGDIYVESNEGRGSTFTIKLPIKKERTKLEPTSTIDRQLID